MNEQALWPFILERLPELAQRTAEHLMLASVSTLIATFFGLLIAVAAFEYKRLRDPITTIVGILQTIPSLAMLVFLMTLYGTIGVAPALTALTLYALLPIVRNTLIGLEGIPEPISEAARGVGMTKVQEITLVRLPMAMPAVVAGIRTAAVVGVGIATLSAFIGAGGLGEFINRGLALSSPRLILLGAIPSAILAIAADTILAIAEWGFRPVRASDRPLPLGQQKFRRRAAASLPALLCISILLFYVHEHPLESKAEVLRIGSKHFTEQLVLAEIFAQLVEAKTKLRVERQFDLGGTLVCHGAITKNQIDMYPEYTGTGLSTVLHIEDVRSPIVALNMVSKEYQSRFNLAWLAPLGFNNTWALIVTQKMARANAWANISDLRSDAPNLHIGLTSEFAERADGFPGIKRIYGLKFGHISDIDTNIAYKALSEKELDVAAGNSTDGRIELYKLKLLEDDKHFFCPYQAAPVIRMDTLKAHPELTGVFDLLANKIDDETMRHLNYEVDGLHRSPAEVAREFLQEKQLIEAR